MHEEIPEVEETLRVERAAKRLVTEVQDLMKTARYRKRCFDQIEGTMTTNKELTAEVERLRHHLEAADQERTNQETQNQNLVGQLENKEQEKISLEAEVSRLQGEKSRALAECGRLKEDNEKLARRQSELQDHTNKMKDDLKILKVNAKRHLEAVIKERDDWKAQCLKASEERDTWSKRCQEMATGIVPVLDLIDPALTEEELRTPQLGLVERCKQAWGWFQDFVKEAGEYTGAHVLSMVRAHYPLIDLKCLEAGYPKEIDPDQAEELRTAQLDLSSKIIGDINLCGGGTAPMEGMPSTSQLEMPSATSQPTKPAVSTSQAPVGPSPSA
ncbi:uncharacterized protein [Miscanthus floridulus]|uniref:uncharacterized protein n=1 Tax=Miscanthus floridulus TaxID=154761 RepID=UPI0034598B23